MLLNVVLVYTYYTDIESGKQIIKAKVRRQKKIAPWLVVGGARVAFVAGRYIFRRIIAKRITRNGFRLTKQYIRRGTYKNGYRQALRDFSTFKPRNVKSFVNKVSIILLDEKKNLRTIFLIVLIFRFFNVHFKLFIRYEILYLQ